MDCVNMANFGIGKTMIHSVGICLRTNLPREKSALISHSHIEMYFITRYIQNFHLPSIFPRHPPLQCINCHFSCGSHQHILPSLANGMFVKVCTGWPAHSAYLLYAQTKPRSVRIYRNLARPDRVPFECCRSALGWLAFRECPPPTALVNNGMANGRVTEPCDCLRLHLCARTLRQMTTNGSAMKMRVCGKKWHG